MATEAVCRLGNWGWGYEEKRPKLIQSSSIAGLSDEQGQVALPLAPNRLLKKGHLKNRLGANPIGC